MSEPLIKPEPPDELTKETRAFWRDIGRNLIRGSVDTIDGTAKQIIAVAGILEGLYFHAIAFTDLLGQSISVWLVVVYLAPIFFWLLSLCAALLVFYPHRYRINIHSSDASHKAYDEILDSKLRMLRIASLTLLLGVAGLLPAVYAYLMR